MGSGSALDEFGGGVVPGGNDEEILGERAWSSAYLFHVAHPGSHEKGEEHHGQWASRRFPFCLV